jgi:hypothetical protein
MKAIDVLTVAVEKTGIGDVNDWILQEVVCNDELGKSVSKIINLILVIFTAF